MDSKTLQKRAQAKAEPRTGLWPAPKAGWIACAAVVILFAAHLAYGALYDAGFLMGIAAALVVAIGLANPSVRDDLLRIRGLAVPGVTFGLVLLVGLWTLTPWTPGGPHPVWSYAGTGAGASTIDKSATAVELIKLLGLATVFVLGLLTGARDARARFAVRLTLVAGAVFGLWAFAAAATGAIYQSQGHRLEARFLNPNTAGTFFAILTILAVSELVRRLRSQGSAKASQLFVDGALLLTFIACLLATASRGAMLALLAGGVVYVLVQLATGSLKIGRAVIGAFAAMAILLIVVTLLGDTLLDRLFHSQEAAIVRHDIYAAHWAAFLDSPLFGYGLGTAETVNKTLISVSNFPVLWNIRAILNVYLQWLEEAGLVGAIPMFATIGLLIAMTWRGALRRSRMTGLLAALLATDAIFLAHGATDFALQVPSMAALWAWLLGLQVALAQGSSRR